MPLNVNGYTIDSNLAKSFKYKDINNNGLLLHLDAGVLESYPGYGSTFYDMSSNSNNFSITGASWNSSGYFSFSGSSNYMTNASFNVPGLKNIATCVVWMKPDSGQNDGTYNGIFSYGIRSCASQTFLMSMNNSYGPTMAKWCDDFTSPTSTMNTSAWWQYTLVLNKTSVNFYLNDYGAGSGTLSGGNNIGVGTAAIGSTDIYGRLFKGSIASLKFYNRALSSTEITYLYNLEKSRFGL